MDTIQSSSRFLTKQTMYPLVEEFLHSEMSQRAFCTERGLTYHGFQYWIRKYREQQNPKEDTSGDPKAVGFIPLKLKRPTAAPDGVEIEYPDGTKIRFGENTTAEYVKHFIPGLLR